MIARAIVWRQLYLFARAPPSFQSKGGNRNEDQQPFHEDTNPESILNEKIRRKFDPAYNNKEKVEERANSAGDRTFMNEYSSYLDNTSILNRFRKRVFQRSTCTPEEEQIDRNIKEYDSKLRQILDSGSKQEQLSASQKLVQKFMNDKEIFHGKTNKPNGISEYADYSPYKTNRVIITDRKLSAGEDLSSRHMKRSYKFLNELGPEYAEHVAIQEAISMEPGLTVNELANRTENIYQTSKGFAAIEDRTSIKASQIPANEDLDVSESTGEVPDYMEEINSARLSPHATFKIYQLYTEGWSVRDLSKRFGILPSRVKFIVWSKAQLFMEVLPRLGFEHFRKCMNFEMQYGKEFGFMDYGIDLDEMSKDTRSMKRITSWNKKLLDIRDLDKERQERAVERVQKRTDLSKSHVMVDNGTHGTGSYMYFMREWKIFRGKGSDYYHLSRNTFKRLYKNKGRRVYC